MLPKASRLSQLLRFAIAILLACAASLAADPALPQDFPRLGHYGSMYGDGYPLVDSTGAPWDENLDRLGRYDVVTLEASPISEYRPDIAAELRARRPGIRLLAYVNAHYTWFPQARDSLVHYPTRYHRFVRDNAGFLYNTFGEYYGTRVQTFANVNLAKRNGAGRYVIAEGLADLFYDAIVATGTWDGVFLDTYCDDILWMEGTGEIIDVARAGYPNRTAFAAAWRAGTDAMASRLRARSGGSAILAGNCGPGSKYAWFNGWMRENFPFQGGGNWFENMFREPGGYFADEANHLAPLHNWIFTAIGAGTNPYSAQSSRKLRLGLGSASLASGYHVIGVPERQSRLEPYHEWWYDEYAVDLATGQASTLGQHTGWLGQPIGPAYQMVWVGTNPDAVTNPEFEIDVTTGWDFTTGIGSTILHDLTTAGSGAASARLVIPIAGPLTFSTSYASESSIPVLLNNQYAATFWAKSSVPRSARVLAGRATGGGSFAAQDVDLTTQWKRYQVVLVPNASGDAKLRFDVGDQAGDVWIDDAHFQSGVTNLWRRDFQNGIVLVNPSSLPLNTPLGATFRKITGVTDPVTNNGAPVSQASVPANDALFLILGSDIYPPAGIVDLRPLPPGAPGTP
jgi:hypothetical protein